MKLKRFFSFLLFAAVITAFTACDEDEDTSVPVDVTLNFTAPSDTITSFTWAEGKATFTDLNRGKEYELDLSQSSVITLSSGLYNITVEGAIASASGEILAMYAARKTTYKSLPHRLRSLWSYRSTPRATPLFSKRFM